jgi:farnesyl diphosphate synthase
MGRRSQQKLKGGRSGTLIGSFWAYPANLAGAMSDSGSAVDALISGLLASPAGPEARVYEVMRYAALGPGKRLRPFLVLASSHLFDVSHRNALQVAAAVELLHTYSLIHDDLPAMDDADLRRGRATCHKIFDDAAAILAGDGLLTLAFEVLSHSDAHDDPAVRVELISCLARAAGAAGMVGGQQLDLLAEHNQAFDIHEITRMQRLKTGALLAFSCKAGAILGNAAAEHRRALIGYAHDLGLAFQIADDLLDVESTEANTGKSIGRDAAAGKATFVSLLGLAGAKKQAQILAAQAIGQLEIFGDEADLLRQAAHFVVERKS